MKKNRKITCSSLGLHNQWGNQVIQYAFLRIYAGLYGATLETPKWVGQYLFGFDDPPISEKLPESRERNETGPQNRIPPPINPNLDEWIGTDWTGYAQYHTSHYHPHQEFLFELYSTPIEPQASRVNKALRSVKNRGETLIGLHLRRGDSGRVIYPFTPIEWCLKWLHFNWNRFESPILYLSTEDAELAKWFINYNPVLPEQMGIEFQTEPYPKYTYPHKKGPDKARQYDFFPDWYILQHSDVVLASDSSFSITAALTNPDLQELWRPRLSLGFFEKLDRWNMPFCNREHVDDYPGIPGTILNTNPGFGWEGFKQSQVAIPENPDNFTKYMVPV